MGLTWQIDTTGFQNLARELSNMSGAPQETVILERAGHVLEDCIRYTPVRSAGQIEMSVKFRNRNLWEKSQLPGQRGDPVLTTNKAGVIGFWDESNFDASAEARKKDPRPVPRRNINGKTFHIMNDVFRWSDVRWARFQAKLAELASKQTDLGAARRSRGVMARSWWQIAEALGLNIRCPGYIKNARPLKGQIYVDGTAEKVRTDNGFFVDLINSNPILINKLGGARILSQAVQATINQFDVDLSKGVFDDIKRRAERYPGVFVK